MPKESGFSASLAPLGWDPHFETDLNINENEFPARVVAVDRDLSRVQIDEKTSFRAEVTGKLRFQTDELVDFPTVGDWVLCRATGSEDRVVMTRILARKNVITRTSAGESGALQAISANVDWMFVACSLDGDFSLRRIDRYVTLAYDAGVSPVVVLTKADLLPPEKLVRVESEVEERFPGIPVLSISYRDEDPLAPFSKFLTLGKTAVIVGSSGVGKSTLTNRLIGEERLVTQAVREEDSKGRHTTTRRELFILRGGGIVIDTPGMRELQLTGNDTGIDALFADVEALALSCHFSDCGHTTEPRCEIRRAIEEGSLSKERFESYRKMLAEIRYLERRKDKGLQAAEKEKWKKIHKQIRAKNKPD